MSFWKSNQWPILILWFVALNFYSIWTHKTAIFITGHASYRSKVLYFSLAFALQLLSLYFFVSRHALGHSFLLSILLLTLLSLAWADYQCLKLPTVLLIISTLLTFLCNEGRWSEGTLSGIIFFGILLGLKFLLEIFLNRDALGWGDLWLAICVAFFFSVHQLPTLFLGVGLAGVFAGLIWKWCGCGEKLPFGSLLSLFLCLRLLIME